jgi:hypothetical protein
MEESLAVLEVQPVAARAMVAMSRARSAFCGDFMIGQLTVVGRECKDEDEDWGCGRSVPCFRRW